MNHMPADPEYMQATNITLTPQQVATLRSLLAGSDHATQVSVAEFLPIAIENCSEKSLPTYGRHMRRLADTYGDKPLDQVTAGHLERQAADVRREVIEAKRQKGKHFDPDRVGKGARENYVRATRFFFKTAKKYGLIASNPAEDVKIGERPPSMRRPLTENEMHELWLVATTTGDDPELDALILDTARETAARREGLINLTVQDIDVARRSVMLHEKFGKQREIPVSLRLMERLLEHAVARGARNADDQVLRYIDMHGLTARRFNTLFDRVDEVVNWTRALDVGIHWIRHTTLTDIAVLCGDRVAQKYAGHSDDARGVIGIYTKVSWEELVAAHHELFGP